MKRFFPAMTAALLMASLVSGTAVAAPKFANMWKVYTFNASGQAYASKTATTFSSLPTGVGFNFPSTPDTALFLTDQAYSGVNYSYSLGDLTGRTISASVVVKGTDPNDPKAPVFTYYGEPDSCGGPASVRLFFEGNTKGPFSYTKYWWSNPISYPLAVGGNTLAVSLSDPTLWSDWNGQFGWQEPSGFAAAVKNVTAIGLSFGGGCFFANGVGLAPNSVGAEFRLTNFTTLLPSP